MVLFFNAINFETINILSEKFSKQVNSMSDEELFATDEALDSEFEEIEAPPKKRSKLKWLFFIIVLLIIGAAAVFGLNMLGYLNLPINDYVPVQNLFTGSDDTIKVEPEEVVTPVPLPPTPKIPMAPEDDKPSKAASSAGMKGGYYLKVGSCLYKACQKELSNRMKAMKLQTISRQSVQSTTYFELISDASYLKQRAEEKLRLLNKYNETIGFPYLLRTRKGRYIISFGQFPLEATAFQMKSQLEHLYSQVRMKFVIRPRKDRVTITKLYVGPYNKATAEKVRMRLRENQDFEWIEIKKGL